VDVVVREFRDVGVAELTPRTKRRLAGILHADYETDEGVSTLSNVLARCAQSLAQVYLGECGELKLPISPIPLAKEVAARLAQEDDDASQI